MTDVRTTHPAIDAGCTQEQVRAFELIAIGAGWRVSRARSEALVRKGLVLAYKETTAAMAPLVPVTTTRYEVPLQLRWQWVQWCDENPEEGDDE